MRFQRAILGGSIQGGVLRMAVLLTLLAFVPVLVNDPIPILSAWEAESLDFRFRVRGPISPGGDVVVVAVDDQSLKHIGRWPWPRIAMAGLVQMLTDGGAKVIGIDFLFSEPSEDTQREVVGALIEDYKRLGLLTADPANQAFFETLTEAVRSIDHDGMFQEAMRSAKNTVLAMGFVHEETPENDSAVLHEAALPTVHAVNRETTGLPDPFRGVLLPIPLLAEAASAVGFVNVIGDETGAVRETYTVVPHRGRIFGSIPIQMMRRYKEIEDSFTTVATNGLVRMDDYSFSHRIFINYYGDNQTIPTYSALDVLTGAVAPETFDDRCVFIGGAATGLGDHWANPFTGIFFGVETHATVLDNLLTHRWIRRPFHSRILDLLIVCVIGLVTAVTLPRGGLWRFPVVLATLLGAVFGYAQFMFVHQRIAVSLITPVLQIVLLGISIFSYRFIVEGREKRFLKNAFQQYLHPHVVDRIIKNPDDLSLGGVKKDLTVLFSDIRDFTRISEKIPPEQLVFFMNRYLTVMTDVVLENEGTLDKYIGDCIMAIFGSPEDQSDHVHRACLTAVRMMEALHRERDVWFREGLPAPWAGVGINAGPMVVGNMGSQRRFDYTVMGDNVNIAARLESLTKVYGVKIIVSEAVCDRVKEQFMFREIDYVTLRGKENRVRIFELLGHDYYTGGKYAFLEPFAEGLYAYRSQNWEKAERCFHQTLSIKPNDSPSMLYIQRCRTFRQNPPGSDWNGVY